MAGIKTQAHERLRRHLGPTIGRTGDDALKLLAEELARGARDGAAGQWFAKEARAAFGPRPKRCSTSARRCRPGSAVCMRGGRPSRHQARGTSWVRHAMELSRSLDYLETRSDIDHEAVTYVGLSLWRRLTVAACRDR